MSGIYVTFRDPNGYYGYSATTIEKLLGLDLYANLWPKLILLVLGTALLMFFVNRHIKSVKDKKVKYELNESNEVAVSEVTGSKINLLSHSTGGQNLFHLRAMREGSVSGPSPWLVDNSLLPVSSCHLPPTRLCPNFPFFIRTAVILDQAHL